MRATDEACCTPDGFLLVVSLITDFNTEHSSQRPRSLSCKDLRPVTGQASTTVFKSVIKALVVAEFLPCKGGSKKELDAFRPKQIEEE